MSDYHTNGTKKLFHTYSAQLLSMNQFYYVYKLDTIYNKNYLFLKWWSFAPKNR